MRRRGGVAGKAKARACRRGSVAVDGAKAWAGGVSALSREPDGRRRSLASSVRRDSDTGASYRGIGRLSVSAKTSSKRAPQAAHFDCTV